MKLRFTSPNDQPPGLISSLLQQSYAELLESDPEHWEPEVSKWEQFDREVFEYPDTVGSCVFLSWSDDQLVSGNPSHDAKRYQERDVKKAIREVKK